MQSDNKHLFDKFDELKNTTEETLNKIKAVYEQLDKSLKNTEYKESLVKNIENIKADMANFTTHLKEEMSDNLKNIVDKINNDYKAELEDLKTKLKKLSNFNSEDSTPKA